MEKQGQGSAARQTYPEAYGSDSEDDDYFSANVPARGSSLRSAAAVQTPLNFVPKAQAPAQNDDDWAIPGPSPAGGGAGSEKQRPGKAESHTSAFARERKEPLPMIPDIDRQRCIAANRSINAVWSNGEFGKEKDIYTSGIAKTLRTEFKDAKNPYSTALNIMLYSIDFFRPSYKGSLSLEVMKEFKKWLMDSGSLTSYERQYLNVSLRKIAFSLIMKQPSLPVIKIVCELYCIKAIAATIVEDINELCEAGKYKEACYAATYLGLFKEFDVHKFAIPLLLQSREGVAFEYLIASTHNQNAVTAFFDQMLGEAQPALAIRNYVFAHKIDNVQFNKLEVKPLGKMLDRLRTKFGVGIMDCPNSGRRKRTAALRHLMYRKYILNDEMSEAAFEGLVDDVVAHDEALIEDVLSEFRNYYDTHGAARFALRNAVPLHKITHEVQVAMHDINPNVVVVQDKTVVQLWNEDWEIDGGQPEKPSTLSIGGRSERSLTPSLSTCSKPGIFPAGQSLKGVETQVTPRRSESLSRSVSFASSKVAASGGPPAAVDQTSKIDLDSFYRCPVPLAKIHLLDTPEAIRVFVKELEEAQKRQDVNFPMVVGFDSEWKPILATAGVSLIQIALPAKIYLIDVHQLKRCEGCLESWLLLLEKFFKNDKIIKLGVGMMTNDVPMLAKTTPTWTNIVKEFKGGVDMSQLALDLGRTSPEIFQNFMTGSATGGSGFSLSDLVLAFTGLRLRKDEQFSNWESRPLREAQISYAAADAYCVLDVFKVMKNRAEAVGIKFEATVVRLMEKWQELADGTLKKASTKVSAKQLLESGSQGAVTVRRHSAFHAPQSPGDIKLVCDDMLIGLGRLLRSCGIDTVVLKTGDSHLRCADIALQDDRCIVTTKTAHKILAPYVPAGHCYLLQTTNRAAEDLHDVLTYFNIVVTPLHLYTRCQVCNDNEFVKIRSELLKDMYSHSFPRELQGHRTAQDKISGCIELDEATVAATTAVGRAPNENTQRRWTLLPENSLVTEGPSDLLRTKKGAMVGVKGIPSGVLDKVEHVFACNHCGKCYWPKAKAKSPEPFTAAAAAAATVDDISDDEAYGASDLD